MTIKIKNLVQEYKKQLIIYQKEFLKKFLVNLRFG